MSEERAKRRRTKRTSDMPVDLTKEREAFVRTFLKKGVELTEHLIAENEALRTELAQQQVDNARLRAQLASDDAIRRLLETIEKLEAEKLDLLHHAKELENATRSHQGRYSEIEQELNDLANLYVASFTLHSTLSPRGVVRNVKELLGQLVGADAFAIYVLDAEARVAHPVSSEGIATSEIGPINVGEGPIGSACATGERRIRRGKPLPRGTLADPLAIIPLLADDRPIGAIAIAALLVQKTGWASVDEELFKLLGAHAGTALIAATLYGRTTGPTAALVGLREALNLV